MIYLPVQFYALCLVPSDAKFSFNTKCLIMPHATLNGSVLQSVPSQLSNIVMPHFEVTAPL